MSRYVIGSVPQAEWVREHIKNDLHSCCGVGVLTRLIVMYNWVSEAGKLCFVHNLSYDEIASLLNVESSKIRYIIFEDMRRIRKYVPFVVEIGSNDWNYIEQSLLKLEQKIVSKTIRGMLK